jgi:hypothetical protein
MSCLLKQDCEPAQGRAICRRISNLQFNAVETDIEFCSGD